MDILTEIYRIKQVMGLITEQTVENIQGSFDSTTGDAAHNFKEFESKVDTTLADFYSRRINPKIYSIDVTITKNNNNSFTTTYSAEIRESDDGKAWMGFTSRGSYGQGYVERANGQIDGTENKDGKSLVEKLKAFGAVEIEKIKTYENTAVPVLQYFYQFTKEDKKPHLTNNQAPIQSVRDTNQVVNATTPQNAPNTNNTQVNTATSPSTATVNTGVLIDNTLEEGQPGDPYVYIKNEDGDFLTYKCGKTNEKCPDLRTNLYSVPWINVTKKLKDNPNSDKYKNAKEAIRISIYKEGTPTPEEEITPTPDEEITYEDYDFFIISRYFRDLYYQFLIKNIQEYMKTNYNAYTMYKYPDLLGDSIGCPFGERLCKVDYKLGFKDSNNEKIIWKLDLNKIFIYDKNNKLKQSNIIGNSTINKSIDSFISEIKSKGITIEDNNYKIKRDPENAVMGLSYVFDDDESSSYISDAGDMILNHLANKKVQDLIRDKGYSIHKT